MLSGVCLLAACCSHPSTLPPRHRQQRCRRSDSGRKQLPPPARHCCCWQPRLQGWGLHVCWHSRHRIHQGCRLCWCCHRHCRRLPLWGSCTQDACGHNHRRLLSKWAHHTIYWRHLQQEVSLQNVQRRTRGVSGPCVAWVCITVWFQRDAQACELHFVTLLVMWTAGAGCVPPRMIDWLPSATSCCLLVQVAHFACTGISDLFMT
jgi:hypothetical protein